MTWHDRGEGNHNPEQRLPQAFAYHSGTILTVLSILRCRKYLPQCLGHSIFAGRTYAVIKDFHDYVSIHAQATQYHKFPIGQVKVIQQLMVTKTNVCPHNFAGCIAASVNHLGIYALMIAVENLGPAAAATHDLSWVDELKKQDVISMCNVRD
eukprot:4873929-Amphidinium_carterae.2